MHGTQIKLVFTAISGITLSILSTTTLAATHCNMKPQKCMTINGLVNHLKAFQFFADNNNELPGARLTNTQGYIASRDYVIKTMQAAGYQVTLQDVPLEISVIDASRTFEMTLPENKSYAADKDYLPLVNSGGGDIKATVQKLSGDESGCNMDDFSNFHAGNAVLLKFSDTCKRYESISNAINAGAKAIIGYYPGRGVMYLHAGYPIPSEKTPVLQISSKVADEFKHAISSGVSPEVHIKFNMVKKTTATQNIFAESRKGNSDHIVMVGAHLDSTAGSAGMNDNASAAATVLETAVILKDANPVNKLRFVWWTGEELGLLGSNYYMEKLSAEEKAKIKVYLNYEILGAPNGGRMIMGTADGITPKGSEKVTKLYADYFTSQHLKYFIFDPRMGSAGERSDMLAFMKAGIPVGYLVTGADLPWLPELSAIFTDLPGRIVGMQTHPCYHEACDKLTLSGDELKDPNFDFNLYLQMSKAATYAVYTYSMKS